MGKLIDNMIADSQIMKAVEGLSAKVEALSDLLAKSNARIEQIAVSATMPANPATALGFKGDGANGLYRGFVGSERPIATAPSQLPLSSTVCRQVHYSLDQYRFWCHALKERPRYHRKQWEFFYIAQVLFERGMLKPGRRGIGFGVGREPLPALFASFGAEVVATDQSLEGAVQAGWARTGQHTTDLSVLNERGICTDRMFGDLVSFAEADMNAIDPKFDGQFDFCWSACSLEHLGSLRHGLEFFKNSLRMLKPGGIAVHTTEFNLGSNDATYESPGLSIYRRQDIDNLIGELAAEGHLPSPVDYALGDGFAETVVDLPPFGRGEPHLRLRIADYDCTSIGVIAQRGV